MNFFKKPKEVWEKKNEKDSVWWLETDKLGEHIFSFDKKEKFNLSRDYPNKLTPEQKEIFDKENSHWANFFRDRK